MTRFLTPHKLDKQTTLRHNTLMKIFGQVSSIVYRNNDNNYTIIKLSTGDEELTVTGKFPVVGVGENLQIEGDIKVHPKYGKQIEAKSVKIEKPTTSAQIVKYLSSGLISGVGEITANNIVEHFGEQTLDIMLNKPIRLAEVRGISKKKAIEISLKYLEIIKLQDAVMFLQQYDISTNMAVKIYTRYKNQTETVISSNPYKLVEDIDGIGFKTADRLAAKMGVEPDSNFRIRAGIVYTLGEIAEKRGSTICAQENLVACTAELLGIDAESRRERFEQVIADLIIDGYLYEKELDGAIWLGLEKYMKMERVIGTRLAKLIASSEVNQIDITSKLQEYEKMNHITLHERQKEAIKSGVNNGLVVITGGPGTGKTTIIKAINGILKSLGLKTLLLAPTGRASKRMSVSTGENAMTIHRALDINFKGKEFANAFDTKTEVEADAIIVDEFSMVDTFVMYNLINAVDAGMRLILVGDKDQLPSVGAGNVLADIIAMPEVPVVSLSQIFRQAGESMIVVNAHRINNGEMLDLSKKDGDFFFMQKDDPYEASNLVVDLVQKRLPAYIGESVDNVQVIAPVKVGEMGVDNLNNKLQQALNPKSSDKKEVVFNSKTFRIGDRVMQTANNYDKEWINGAEFGKGVFNGDIGYITDIEKSGETVITFEDGRVALYTITELDEVILSYAITIHKSQGSEFDAVVIPVSGGSPTMMTRNLLYTAVTRAKKMVVLVGKASNVVNMINNTYSVKRNTLLKEFTHDALNQLNLMFDE